MNTTPEGTENMSITTFRTTDSTVDTEQTAAAPQVRELPDRADASERSRIDVTPDDGAREHTEPDDNSSYLPELQRECERRGIALHLTDDPAVDLPEIKTVNGRVTCIARTDELGIALDELRLTYEAAAVCIANATYDEALKQDNPAVAMDDICDALPDVMPEVFKEQGTAPDFAAVLLPEVADRLWAFTVVAHARADVGNDYGYAFDVMADALKRGVNTQAIRAEVPRVVERLRIESAVSVAMDAITTAVTTALAGLAANPHDVAERLHMAVEDAQAEHLARVGGMSLERAEAAEAFSTANSAMARAVSRSADPEGTAQGLRAALRIAIDETAPSLTADCPEAATLPPARGLDPNP
ncbi:hypothetical protein OHA71_42705 [Streptomyces sp. NBC_00444]|uniref:hypothetical protein n=1 Tax=Streptomyces sp. NBC_00444 TaxID=2975744 RepID=UPI002E205085